MAPWWRIGVADLALDVVDQPLAVVLDIDVALVVEIAVSVFPGDPQRSRRAWERQGAGRDGRVSIAGGDLDDRAEPGRFGRKGFGCLWVGGRPFGPLAGGLFWTALA